MRMVAETPHDPLLEGFRLRVALAAHHHLDAIRRLTRIGVSDADNEPLLVEAQRLGQLALQLTEAAFFIEMNRRADARLRRMNWYLRELAS